MRRRKWRLLLWAAATLVTIAVVVYNMTTSCPCHSHWLDLASMPLYNWVLVGLNLAALVTYLILQKRNRARVSLQQCPHCQTCLRPDWLFCPSCGQGKESGRSPGGKA